MKTLTLFLTLTFILSASLPAFGDGFESAGPASCNGSWDGTWPWQKSKPTITEYWEWKDLESMNPYIGRSDKPKKPAKLFGFVGTYQATRGRGTVGVSADGEVDGYDLGFEWKIKSVSGDDSTHKATTGTKHTTTEGTYALSGSGQVMATAGGGSIGVTITGTGGTLRGSGTITFSDSPTYGAPSPLVVTTEKDEPQAYECAHQSCEVALPNKHHHRVTCKVKVYLGLGSVVKVNCNRKYYACQTSTCPNDNNHIIPHACGHEDEKKDAWKHEMQASCSGSTTRNGSAVYCQSRNFYLCQHDNHEWPTASNPPSGSNPTPTPSYHACGEHETTVSGDHSLQASCSSSNSNGNCTVTNFYACDSHTHSYPSPPEPATVTCPVRTCQARYDPKSSAAAQHTHQTFPCGAHSGWACSNPHIVEHSTPKTCKRCGTTFYSCNRAGPCVTRRYGTHENHSAAR